MDNKSPFRLQTTPRRSGQRLRRAGSMHRAPRPLCAARSISDHWSSPNPIYARWAGGAAERRVGTWRSSGLMIECAIACSCGVWLWLSHLPMLIVRTADPCALGRAVRLGLRPIHADVALLHVAPPCSFAGRIGRSITSSPGYSGRFSGRRRIRISHITSRCTTVRRISLKT